MSAKVQGLANQLAAAQQALSEGSIAPLEVVKIQSELSAAEQSLKAFNFQTDVGKEKLDTLANSAARLKKILSGDPIEVQAVKNLAERDFNKEKYSLAAENIALEQQYYKDSEFLALQRRNKILNYERDIFETRQELAEKSIFNQTEATARILSGIAQSTKSITEVFADEIVGIYEKVGAASDKFLDKTVGKIPIIGGVAKNLARSFLTKVTTGLLDTFLPSGLRESFESTGNPLLDENKKQTKSLQNIEKAIGGFGGGGSLVGTSSTVRGGTGGGILGLEGV